MDRLPGVCHHAVSYAVSHTASDNTVANSGADNAATYSDANHTFANTVTDTSRVPFWILQ